MNAREVRRTGVRVRSSGIRCRAIRRVGFSLALFALLIQAVVAFGHHHFGFVRSSIAGAASRTEQAAAPHGDRRGGHMPAAPEHEPCPICMAIHAPASPGADAPQLALPMGHASAPLSQPALASLSPPSRAAAFESRAPPLS
jgi:hypothetical protein